MGIKAEWSEGIFGRHGVADHKNRAVGRDLQLALINAGGVYALAFPCHRVLRGLVKMEINEYLSVRPAPLAGVERLLLSALSSRDEPRARRLVLSLPPAVLAQ